MDDEDALRVNGSGFGHALLSARETDGREVREAVPVRRIEANIVEVLGSPAYLMGFAGGDTLKVAADHSFEVVERGPNVCVQAFADPPLSSEAIDHLRSRFAALDGTVEGPGHRRFVVVTVPSVAGTRLISEIMDGWSAPAGRVEWQFGTPLA